MQLARSGQGSAQARGAHPLLGAFPLAVMALATFVVLFTLTMAMFKAGAGPALPPSMSTSLVASSSGSGAGSKRTNGAGESTARATPAVASKGAAIATRASGARDATEAGNH